MMRGCRQLGAMAAAVLFLSGAGAAAGQTPKNTAQTTGSHSIIAGDTPRAKAAPLTMRKIILVGDSTSRRSVDGEGLFGGLIMWRLMWPA